MEGMGVKFTPAIDRETSINVWAYSWHFWDTWLVQTVLIEGLAHLRLPTKPLHPPLPLLPTPYNVQSVILQWF